MASSSELIHSGIIKSIDEKIIKVSVASVSACASCKAKSVCGPSDIEEKIIEVPNKENIYSIGDKVEVILNQSLGFKALFLGYILPFIIVMISLIVSLLLFSNQGIAGIISLGILIPYYFILYFYREKIKKTFSFSLRKQNNFN